MPSCCRLRPRCCLCIHSTGGCARLDKLHRALSQLSLSTARARARARYGSESERCNICEGISSRTSTTQEENIFDCHFCWRTESRNPRFSSAQRSRGREDQLIESTNRRCDPPRAHGRKGKNKEGGNNHPTVGRALSRASSRTIFSKRALVIWKTQSTNSALSFSFSRCLC